MFAEEGTAMQTIRLSEAAVATLRFEIKGWKKRVRDQDLPAYGELVEAGIMEPAGERFRFTEDGLAHRQTILDRESERIERERYEPPDASGLSEAARELLRRYLAGDRAITESNRPTYRELVAARVMIPVHTFVGGREAAYRLTYWGYERRHELARVACARETA
jgi:hypothetical protein